jgi:glycosyltransferase involved in cell wall biosynthesis
LKTKLPYHISLVAPCYNEEDGLRSNIELTDRLLSGMFEWHEIIIVNDASTDRSPEIARELESKLSSVRVYDHYINSGIGVGIMTGIKMARGEIALWNSIDYPFDLEELPRILNEAGEFDAIVVERRNRKAYSFYRKLLSWGQNMLMRLLFWSPYTDLNFLHIYKSTIVKEMIPAIKSRSPAFVPPEIILRARRRGHLVKRAKAEYHEREYDQAKHGTLKDILQTMTDMIVFRWYGKKY